MKKFVSLCAFVAALSLASCGGEQTENTATQDSTAAAPAVETPAVETPVQDTVPAQDSTAVEAAAL